MSKPHLFIGSSGQELEPARTIAMVLNDDTSSILAKTWKDSGTFPLTRSTLEGLLNELEISEFGAFVLGADDIVTSKGEHSYRARDNVIFELGVFLGHFGPERTFILNRLDPNRPLTLPSDLYGITLISFSYDKKYPSESVASACHRIRLAVENILAAARPPIRSADVVTQVQLELSEREYAPVSLRLERAVGNQVSFHFTNRMRADVRLLHICFPSEIDMNFLPWVSGLKEQRDPHAPDLRYFWLTDDQLQHVQRRHGFKFLLHGRSRGSYEIKIVAKLGSKTIVVPVMVEIA